VAGVLAVLAFVSAYYAFASKLSVSSSFEPEEDPFRVPFILKNESLFSLHDINFNYQLHRVEFERGNRMENVEIFHGSIPVKVLEAGESVSVAIPKITAWSARGADVTLDISYRPRLLPLERHYKQRFRAKVIPGKGSTWLPAPESDPK